MNKISTIPKHPFHLAIGRLVDNISVEGCEVFKDPACDVKRQRHRILSYGPKPDQVAFCQVDLIITLRDKATVIIEIEESNVKPLHIFGKFFASAFSTHLGDMQIDNLPLLFVQVLDTSRINLEEGNKKAQWDRIKLILSEHARKWPNRKVQYRLFEGRKEDFGADGKKGQKLIREVTDFLNGEQD